MTSCSNSYLEEVQDFSMPNKKQMHQQHYHSQSQQQTQSQQSQPQPQHQHQQSKGKLDDMLSKLMQKKNCVCNL